MAVSCYDALSRVYDRLNGNADYGGLADFIETCFEEYGSAGTRRVLDLGCGTGPLTAELAMLGYDVTGIDISDGMLAAAGERARALGLGNVSFEKADMRRFRAAKKFDAAVCTMDGINHLLSVADVTECFRRFTATTPSPLKRTTPCACGGTGRTGNGASPSSPCRYSKKRTAVCGHGVTA